jgi:hypothetical protein
MRNLRKFNENVEDTLDVAYIIHCFNDMVEYAYNDFDHVEGTPGEYRWSNKWDVEIKEDENLERKKPTECYIFVDCPTLGVKFTPDGYKGKISDFIQFNSDMNKFLLKLNGSINNLKNEYPNYVIDVIYEQALLRGHQGYDYYGVNIKLK